MPPDLQAAQHLAAGRRQPAHRRSARLLRPRRAHQQFWQLGEAADVPGAGIGHFDRAVAALRCSARCRPRAVLYN
eukprot:1832061-Rhodomonas_salina.2